MLEKLKQKETYQRYFKSLRFAFHCITRPLDGFWDLTHEKRGTIAAANTILFLTVLARIMMLQYSGFVFVRVYWPTINIFLYIASILFPLALFCIGNWGLTTLFDGKGKLSQIYMATCYALTPYPLIQFPMILLSNILTVEEKEFYTILGTISILWPFLLIVAAMIQIHEYKLSKTIIFMVFTVFAMLVMVFILLLFFSMISQGISYFISLAREIMFRL